MAAFARGRCLKGDGGTPPPPYRSILSPDHWMISAFAIICLVTRRRIIARTAMSYNILYQVGGCAGCSRVETRISGTGSGLAGESQEVGINILRGTHCEQPLTLRVLIDLLTSRHCKKPNRANIAIGISRILAIGGFEPQRGVKAPPMCTRKIR